MNWNWTDLNIAAATPEIVLLTGLFAVLLADLWTSDENRYITHYLSIGVMLSAVLGQLAVWSSEPSYAFSHMYVVDGISQLGKLVAYLGTTVLFVYAKPYNQMRGIFKGEFYTLAMFALIGVSVMISSAHFLTAYVGLELLSLSLYAMIALRRDSAQAAEAALKYFVLGALASGILLYGISMVYGATGSLNFAEIANASELQNVNGWLLKLGVLFIVAAVAFKFGAVPFHMWVPDVYQGAPTSVAVFIGSVPKIAATVFTFRIMVDGLVYQKLDWQLMFAALAVVSLLVGNLAAMMQSNIKRMFAFSTISHMGFILLGFLASVLGVQAALFYAITYILMSLAGFGVLMLLSREGHECENVADLAGLNQRNAWYALLMLLVLFSMAGIPPLMGFYAKFAILKALMTAEYAWVAALAVYAVVMSLIGAFYYLRVVKVMYFDEATDHTPIAEQPMAWVLSLNALLLLVWGVLPTSMVEWVKTAIERTF
ncbi:NADH-quinone oxidoreductase subunit NuoN [Wielerella bovis]|uniref:NADH-quinone oxidoreductase subunit NuoN n=1 Tax=Wielerella bovis TaxID=2917790 RepID=UPI002019F329|nr:NADH-quinone oxidoreductase subunit NuoN [Wielerella bovis]ULJ60566.1 NADH-quinone oxidoreductase subunit NuoN [Wielerella bovis]